MLCLGFQFGFGVILAIFCGIISAIIVKNISLHLARVKINKALKKALKDNTKGEK